MSAPVEKFTADGFRSRQAVAVERDEHGNIHVFVDCSYDENDQTLEVEADVARAIAQGIIAVVE